MQKQIKPALTISYLLKIKAYKFVLILFGVLILLGAITTFLPEPEIEKPMVIEGLLNDILFSVFFGPVVETLIIFEILSQSINAFI